MSGRRLVHTVADGLGSSGLERPGETNELWSHVFLKMECWNLGSLCECGKDWGGAWVDSGQATRGGSAVMVLCPNLIASGPGTTPSPYSLGT